MDNCLEHGQPHASYGRCAEYTRIYGIASDQYIQQSRESRRDGLAQFRLPDDLMHCRWDDSRWPEPHEGIIGTERTVDDLLDLSDEAMARRKIMCAMAHAISILPYDNPLSKRLRDPQIGDLVIESTAMYGYPDEKYQKGLGILLATRTEWWTTKEEHEQALAREKEASPEYYEPWPRITDTAWYIQYGSNPEAVCRWTNCSFMALPLNQEMARIR